jgi:hypothetical protein
MVAAASVAAARTLQPVRNRDAAAQSLCLVLFRVLSTVAAGEVMAAVVVAAAMMG